MPTQDVKRKLVAILSADVKGYSRLMGEDEVGTIRILTAYKEVMTNLIQQHHGRVVDAPGDNLLAEFASVVDAVECGVEIQKELKTRNTELPAGEGGLKETSMAKCEQVTTLDKSFLIRGPFAGTIDPFLMQEIEKAIQRSIGIPAV